MKVLRLALAPPVISLLLLSACISTGANPAPVAAQQHQVDSGNPVLSLADLRARFADDQSRYITIHGMELHYKDEGTGPVLLLLHGSQSSLRTYDRITILLQDRYRIIRLDLPGYGLSSQVAPAAIGKVAPVEVVEEFVDRLGIDRLSAVGVSSGGTMAAFLAARRPELVEQLVLSNMPSDRYDASHLVMPESFLAAQKRFAHTGRYDRNFWEEYLRYFAGNPARMTDEKIDEYYAFGLRPNDPNLLAMVAQVGDGVAAQAEFAKITAPTLLIWGTADPLLPESASAALAGHLSQTTVSRVLLNDVGHYPPLEAPDRFAAIMATWLENSVPANN